MAISNTGISGFRKWAEIHDPQRGDARSVGVSVDQVAAVPADQTETALAEQSHRPWLVPGTGKL